MMTRLLPVVVLSAWILSGCSTTSEVRLQPNVALPTWFTHPPQNTADKLEGIGSGTRFEEAKQAALADLLAKLSVSIESTLVSHSRFNQGQYEEQTTSDIRSEVSKIRLSNYEVVAAEQVRFDQFVVWVSSDRVQFARSLEHEVETKLEALDRTIHLVRSEHVIRQYQVLSAAIEQSNALIPKLYLLSSLKRDFSFEPYQQRLKALESQREQAKQMLSFSLSGDVLSQALLPQIQAALSQQGFKKVETQRSAQTLNIELETTRLASESAGIQIVTLTVQAHITGQPNLVTSPAPIQLKGYATQGYAHAQANAVNKLAELIQAQGINKVLGIPL